MTFPRPCLDCGTLTDKGNRCVTHATAYQQRIDERRKPKRNHYSGTYRARAKQVRDTAQVCWICKQGPIPNDPWTADHYYPGLPDSPLLPAHRSCNSRRKNQDPHPDNLGGGF